MGKLAVIILFGGILIGWAAELHDHMTDEEIHDVFRVKRHEVHDLQYTVAPVFHTKDFNLGKTEYAKSGPRLKFRAFRRNFTLYLEEYDNVLFGKNTPIFRVSIGLHGETIYTRIHNTVREYFQFYRDQKRRAAITSFRSSEMNRGNQHFDGVIDDNFIIRSLPKRIHDEILGKIEESVPEYDKYSMENLSDSFFDEVLTTATPHVIIQRHSLENHATEVSIKRDRTPPKSKLRIPRKIDSFTNHLRSVKSKFEELQRRSDTIYPEILIVVDHKTFSLHGKNLHGLLKYMATFWNAVDLRFREFERPKIRLNIAGIIVPKESEAVPYLESHREKIDTESECLLASETLDAMKEFFNRTFPRDLCPFDIVFAFTPRKLGHYYGSEELILYDAIKGIANIGGACGVDSGDAIALVKDNGGFDGVRTAAHELGHLMGAPHDEEKSARVNGKPCNLTDGYMMSGLVINRNSFHWSPCSVERMRQFFESETSLCLRNKPNVGKTLSKDLPGRSVNRDQQCESIEGHGFKATLESYNSCTILSCFNGGMETARDLSYFPAEGSRCGETSICLDGECVLDPEIQKLRRRT